MGRIRRLLRTLLATGPRATLLALRARRRGAKQKTGEFAALLKVVGRPQVVVEIGSLRGGTLWAWTRVATPDAVIVAVDLAVEGYIGNISTADGLARSGQTVELVVGDSHDESTLRRVVEVLNGRRADFLFIDGDHSYQGVKADYEMYGPLVRPGGLIAFHDILPQQGSEVAAFWAELDGHELLDETETATRGPWGGIGFLRVDEQQPIKSS